MTVSSKDTLPKAKGLLITELDVPWAFVPRRNNSTQLVIDTIYWCHLKILGEYFKSKAYGDGGFRIQHIGITGTVPLVMNQDRKSVV